MVRRLCLFLLLFLCAGSATARGRIVELSDEVLVKRSGTIEVGETIDVDGGGTARQGLIRAVPVQEDNLEIEGASLDGVRVPVSTTSLSSHVTRLIAGHLNRQLIFGRHRFVLIYRITGHLNYLQDSASLYWRVTGDDWGAPIALAQVRLRLWYPVNFSWTEARLLPDQGPRGQGFITTPWRGEADVRTSGPLAMHQVLSLSAGIPLTILERPGPMKQRLALASGPALLGLFCLLGLIAFCAQAWRKTVHLRSPAGVLVPSYSPPEGLSAPAVRYLTRMRCDNRALAAAVADLAVRGHIKLFRDRELPASPLKLQRQICSAPLPVEERAALKALASTGETIILGPQSFGQLCSAGDALRESLSRQYEGTLFKSNRTLAATGLVLLFGSFWLIACAVVATRSSGAASNDVFMGALSLTVLIILLYALQTEPSGDGSILAIFALIAGVTASIYDLPMIPRALALGGWPALAFPALACPLILSGYRWMSVPTEAGRKALDEIAGFREFLAKAEINRLDRMTSPSDSDTFERHLPYAIALGVGSEAADGLESTVTAATSLLLQSLGWYSGAGMRSATDSLTGIVAGAVAV